MQGQDWSRFVCLQAFIVLMSNSECALMLWWQCEVQRFLILKSEVKWSGEYDTANFKGELCFFAH